MSENSSNNAWNFNGNNGNMNNNNKNNSYSVRPFIEFRILIKRKVWLN